MTYLVEVLVLPANLVQALQKEEEEANIVGQDYDTIFNALKKNLSADPRSQSSKLNGQLSDLKSGKIEDAASGLRKYLQVPDNWDEATECTIDGMEEEVNRLADCPDCAKIHAEVLKTLKRDQESVMAQRLAEALSRLLEARRSQNTHDIGVHEAEVRQIRQEIEIIDGWFYGRQNAKASGLSWMLLGTSKPSRGMELINPDLASALATKTLNLQNLKFFTQQEFDALGIRNLRMDDFIVSEGFYFKPFQAVAWPDDSVKHPYGTYGQPLCACCKKYGLDHRTISEDLYYVLHEASSTIKCFNGKRDVGRDNAGADGGGMRLDDFCKLAQAIEAKLTKAMVAALRFYTSHSFAAINNALRDSNRKTQHPLSAITWNLHNGIKLQRALDAKGAAATATVDLWRGFADTKVSDIFKKVGFSEYAVSGIIKYAYHI